MLITKLKFEEDLIQEYSLDLTYVTTVEFMEYKYAELAVLQFPIFKESSTLILCLDPIKRYHYITYGFTKQNIPEGEAWFLVGTIREYLNFHPHDHCEYYNRLYDKTVRNYENGGPEWIRI